MKLSNIAEVRNILNGNILPNLNFKFKIGDKARVSKIKGTFEKGYLPNWSEEIFFIRRRIPLSVPCYELKDCNNENIEGLWLKKSYSWL